MDGLVRYETDIDRLNIQATVGASQEAYRNNWFEASKENLTSSELTELNAATANATATGTYSNWAMRSFFWSGQFELGRKIFVGSQSSCRRLFPLCQEISLGLFFLLSRWAGVWNRKLS